MKSFKFVFIVIFTFSVLSVFAQIETSAPILSEKFLVESYEKKLNTKNVISYEDIKGTPYWKKEYIEGKLYLNDTVVVQAPLRYNIYTDEIEYKSNDRNYAIGNPAYLKKALIGKTTFLYIPFIGNGGYYELLESGKCYLLQRRTMRFKPVEYAKPIIGTVPAEFIPEPDVFYLVVDNNRWYKIVSLKSVKNVMLDQEKMIDEFISREKIRSTKKENLIKIVKHYNSFVNN